MNKILLIEDDQSFGYLLTEYLTLHDYEVTWAKSGAAGLKQATRQAFDLGIFDIMLPDQNGYEVAQTIRRSPTTFPFIFLSAKSLKIDKLKGFKAGADDYITKPVDEELLLAKIKALLRRSSKVEVTTDEFEIGDTRFIFSLQQLTYNNEITSLTHREAELLRLFCLHQNKLLLRKTALLQIWGNSDEFSRKSMDVFVSHLRKYLAADGRLQITNVHGQGFIFSVE